MKKISYFIASIAIVAVFAVAIPAHSQVSTNYWKLVSNYINPNIASWGLQIPSLANLACLGTDSNGKFQLGTCGSSNTGLATTSPWIQGQVAYVVDNSHVSSAATSTLGGGTTGLSFSNSPAIIGASASSLSGTLIVANGGTNSSSLGADKILYTNHAGNTVVGTASSTLFGSATPGYVWSYQNGAAGWYATSTGGGGTVTNIATTWPITGGPITTTGTLIWGGLATTSNPTAGNIFYSDGTNGLVPIATTSVSGGTGISLSANAGALIGGSNLTITNTAPDQTVVINAGDGISVSSSYPNFTIYNPFAVATTSNIAVSQLSYFTKTGGKTTIGGVATTSLGVSAPITFSGTLGAQIGGAGGSFGCTNASSGVTGCLTGTDWNTFNGKLGSYDAWTHPNTLGYSATTSIMGFGTTTPKWMLTLASSTRPQLTLTDASLTSAPFNFRAINKAFYLSTSSPLTFATSTNPVLSVIDGAISGLVGIASSTPLAQFSINSARGVWPFAIGSSTGNIFSINASGAIQLTEQRFATSTAAQIDWTTTGPSVLYQTGTAATTINIINATTSLQAGSRKMVTVCNPGNTAGAITWGGVEWVGSAAPTQTTTANVCDTYQFWVTAATSTSASPTFKVFGGANVNIN